jgi:hypothetical protein
VVDVEEVEPATPLKVLHYMKVHLVEPFEVQESIWIEQMVELPGWAAALGQVSTAMLQLVLSQDVTV